MSEADRRSRQSGLQLVAGDMPSYAIANGSIAAAGFITLALFTRWLSTPDYGTYALAYTTAAVGESVLFSWINNAVLRYLPEYSAASDDVRFLGTNFITAVVLLGVVSIVWLSATFLVAPATRGLRAALQVGVLLLIARVILGLVTGLVRARREAWRYAVYTAMSAFGPVAAAVAFVHAWTTSVTVILYATALGTGAVAFWELRRSRFLAITRARYFDRNILRRSARYGIPLVGATFGALVLSVADRYMLEYYRGSGAVGTYSAGYDLADKTLKLLFTVLVASALPVVMHIAARRGTAPANELIARLLRTYIVWMVPVTAVVVALREPIIKVALGRGFVATTVVVPWVAMGTLFWGATQIVAQLFQVQERTGPLLYWLGAAALLNVVLNLWLIPNYGVRGAAMATTASYGAYLVVLWVRRVRVPEMRGIERDFLRACAAGAVAYAAMTVAPLRHLPVVVSAVVVAAIGLVAYVLALRVLGHALLEQSWRDIRAVVWRAAASSRLDQSP